MGRFVWEANKTRVFLDGVEFFLLSNIRATDDYALERVSGIGDIHVKENIPTVAQHVFTMSGYIVKDEQAIARSVIPENGDVALEGRTFSIEIFDKEGPLLRRYEECTCNNADANMTAHRLLMKDATFYAIDVSGQYR